MSGAGLWCWQGQPWYTLTLTHLMHMSDKCSRCLVSSVPSSHITFPTSAPLSSECPGSVVPGEREAACGPVPCTVPGPRTQWRSRQQPAKRVSTQTRALWGGCCGRKRPPTSTRCPTSTRGPVSISSCHHHNPSSCSSSSSSAERCHPACGARGRGSCASQTSLGH